MPVAKFDVVETLRPNLPHIKWGIIPEEKVMHLPISEKLGLPKFIILMMPSLELLLKDESV